MGWPLWGVKYQNGHRVQDGYSAVGVAAGLVTVFPVGVVVTVAAKVAAGLVTVLAADFVVGLAAGLVVLPRVLPWVLPRPVFPCITVGFAVEIAAELDVGRSIRGAQPWHFPR